LNFFGAILMRSIGRAVRCFLGGWAPTQLWLFWIAPLIGGALGGVIYRWRSEGPAGVVEGKEIGMIAMLDLARLLYSFRECHGGLESDEQRWSGASRWID
jgi:hypothetical protein